MFPRAPESTIMKIGLVFGKLSFMATATSFVAAGIATVMPRHGMAMTIGYMLVDLFIGAMPFSLAELSITHQTGVLAQLGGPSPVATPLVAMAAVAGTWAAIGLVRIRRFEV